jgi:hypothetical protein
MPIFSRESLIRTGTTIAEALRPVLKLLKLLWIISCRLLPSALIAMHFFDSVYSGKIRECAFVPAACPKSLQSIVRSGTALLFIPGATSSILKLAFFAYSLYTIVTTTKVPCIAYAVMLPVIMIRPMQLHEVLHSSVMVSPGI